MKFTLQQHLLLSSSCRGVAMIAYVARRRSQLFRVFVVQENGSIAGHKEWKQ